MSTDHQILAALATTTGQDMRYFEMVHWYNGSSTDRSYLCLGKHSMFFLGHDLNAASCPDKTQKDIDQHGKLNYAWVSKVVRDTESADTVLFLLNDNRAPVWMSPRLFVKTDHRQSLLKHLGCSWKTDSMWRLGRFSAFPEFAAPLTANPVTEPSVEAFLKCKWHDVEQYKFMLSNDFHVNGRSMRHDEFKNKDGATVKVIVHAVMTIDQLTALKRGHIRWVANEYKTHLVRGEDHFVWRNTQVKKRANLSGDIAAWWSWELVLRTRTETIICMLLRRQYIPPICNCAQDIAIIYSLPTDKCPFATCFKDMFSQARLTAQTCRSIDSNFLVYKFFVQAKLNALRFDDDGIDWCAAHLKLYPTLRDTAKMFLRRIMKMFVDDGLPDGDILTADAASVLVTGDRQEQWADLPELEANWEANLQKGFGQYADEDRAAVQLASNMWLYRAAKYLTASLDGGLIGERFTLHRMLENISMLQEGNAKIALRMLGFMLHMRPKEWAKPFSEVHLQALLKSANFTNCTFNERVMKAFLDHNFLRKTFQRSQNVEYYSCLVRLLEQDVGVELKSFVCRRIMDSVSHDGGDDAVRCTAVVVDALVKAIRHSDLFICTCASAALVNWSHNNDEAKEKLMQNGGARLACDQIAKKDDDLTLYTLMLMVNITKVVDWRQALAEEGVFPHLTSLLTSSYQHCNDASPIKSKVLAQLCIVIGQFCNDDLFRKHFTWSGDPTIKCLLYMFEHAQPFVSTLTCRVMFALKQLCVDSMEMKIEVGETVTGQLLETLGDPKRNAQTPEFFHYALVLLQVLASSTTICISLRAQNIKEVLSEQGKKWKEMPDLNERRDKLLKTVRAAVD